MVGPNRFDKFVWATGKLPSLEAAARARGMDVTIRVSGGHVETACLAVRTLVALALRCFTGSIRLQVGTAPLTSAGRERVLMAAQEETQTFGEPGRLVIDDGTLTGICLAVGPQIPGFVSAWADGWVAHLNQPTVEPTTSGHAPAVIFAAASAMAKAFAAVVLGHGDAIAHESWSFDALSQQATCTTGTRSGMPEDLGRVALLGAGAIGSAVAFILRYAAVRAHLDIIDFDAFSIENRETTLLIHPEDYRLGRHKADVLIRRLADTRVAAHAIRRRVVAGDEVLSMPYDAFLVAVDNAETRRILDAARASCLFNAALGGRREDAGHVLLSVHPPGAPPLSRLYTRTPGEAGQEPVPTDVTDPCSRLAFQEASLAAPFMGAAAGALLVAAVAARVLDVPTAGYVKLSLLHLQQYVQRVPIQTIAP